MSSFCSSTSRLSSRPLVLQPSLFPTRRVRRLPAKLTHASPPLTCLHRRRIEHFVPKAASVSGSAADYPEQLVGDSESKQTKRRRSVAGVDQDGLVEPKELADADSFFFEFNGVHIHHKICHHEAEEEEDKVPSSVDTRDGIGRIGLPMILLHGFGASVFSWHRVMKPLARIVGSKVLAFDRPAFGLTTRASYFEEPGVGSGDARPLNPYSMAFSVLATISFINLLGVEKAILMGHSAGCLVAVETYFQAPEKVAALILVAPAIVAPLALQKKKEDGGIRNSDMEDVNSNSVSRQNPFVRVWKNIMNLYMNLAGLAMRILQGIRNMVAYLYAKAISAFLRSPIAIILVRTIIDKFGIVGIRNAWFDASQVTEHVLNGYTKPLKTKGWEKALLEYTLALLTDSTSKPPVSKRLSQISCPVLIITGDTDRLVPSWNAERLSRAIPNSDFELIKSCGHLPHEERAEEFLSIVHGFLQRVFGAQSGEALQVAT